MDPASDVGSLKRKIGGVFQAPPPKKVGRATSGAMGVAVWHTRKLGDSGSPHLGKRVAARGPRRRLNELGRTHFDGYENDFPDSGVCCRGRCGGSRCRRRHIAQKRVKWKMQSAWGSNVSHLGWSGKRFEENIGAMSGGKFEVKFFEPGALVPALECFDAASKGSVESCWTTPDLPHRQVSGAVVHDGGSVRPADR